MRPLPLLLLLLPATLPADEVFLKGAGSVSGRIVEETADKVQVDVGSGIIGVPKARIERIVRERSALDDFHDRAKKLGPKDVEGWKALGRWSQQQGLAAQARDAYEKVLAIAPNDREANQALGYEQLNGRWVTREESYRAQGYVKYQGEWMTAAEAQLAQAGDAAYVARRDEEQRASAAAAADAQARAQEAEDKARQAEAAQEEDPLYWSTWGPGVPYWPVTGNPNRRPNQRPSQLPARPPAQGGRR